MRTVIQRVTQAVVEVDGDVIGQISDGLLVFLGIKRGDTEVDADYLIQKILTLRVFEDEVGKMNKSVVDTMGSVLVVSQFTLYADISSGTRPGFSDAEDPERAKELYRYFIEKMTETGIHVETGEFGAEMQVDLINNGPVTIILEK